MKEYIQYSYTDTLFIPMNSYSLILYTSGLEAWYCIHSLYDSWNNRYSWELILQPYSLDSDIWPFQTLSWLAPCISEQYSLLSLQVSRRSSLSLYLYKRRYTGSCYRGEGRVLVQEAVTIVQLPSTYIDHLSWSSPSL